MKKKKERGLWKRMERMQNNMIKLRKNSMRSLSLMSSMMKTHQSISHQRLLTTSTMIIT
jgi:hypothetical protein